MRKQFTFLLFLLPFIIEAQSDSIRLSDINTQLERINKLRNQANYQEALELCDSMLAVLLPDSVKYDTLIADVYVEMGLSYLSLQEYENAKKVLLKGLKVIEKVYGVYTEKSAKILIKLGITYYVQGDNNSTLFYYKKGLSVMDSIASFDNPFWPVLYTNLGNYYINNYDLDNALLFYTKAIAVDEEVSKDSLGILIGYFNLGATYNFQSDYEQSLYHYNKSLKIFQNNVTQDSIYWSMIQCNIGDSYFKMGLVDNAQRYYNQSLEPLEKKQGYNAFKSRAYRALGKCYKKKREFQKSLRLFNKSLVLARAKGGNTIEIVYDCYKYLAETYGEMWQKEVALSLVDSAFSLVTFDENKPIFWNSIVPKSTILEGVDAKTEILIRSYSQNQDETDLYQAYKSNLLSLNIIDSIKQDLKEKTSQQFVIDRFFSVYEHAMDIQYELFLIDRDENHIDEAFKIAEKSKSNLLLEAVHKSKALAFANLPQEVVNREVRLKSEITNTERQLHTLSANEVNRNEIKLNNLKHQLFDLKIAMQELLTELETKYPRYYDLKYKSTSADISIVQNELLEESSSLLEYFVGEENIYALVINNQQSNFIKMGATKNIEHLVKEFCNMTSKFSAISTDMDKHCVAFTKLAYTLYQKLIQPVEGFLNEHTIIIPDGVLTYLSFDALIGSTPKNIWDIRNYDFLVKHYTFSYNYSADLMLEMKTLGMPAAKNKLLAIAPSFETDYTGSRLRSNDLAPLHYNVEEVKGLMTLCDGKTLINEGANKKHFLNEAGNYKAIHFATHGKANDRSGAYSYLAFSQNGNISGDENILFAIDVYNLDLRADLVVLSACETGIGEWERGEGMISLARAFSYAGASHIVTTLWKVSDNKAGGIMQFYYKNLQSGMGKSTALRQAKLSYLAENSRTAAHPFYWASFISVGNDESLILDLPQEYWISWIIGGVVLSALISILSYKYIFKVGI